MAQQVILAAQLVLIFYMIGRCNNYAVLQSIPCSPECKIVGQILLDHPLSYALTATTDVPVVYLQQFWRTVSKVPGPKETIKFMLNTKPFVYTVDMFRDILQLLVDTLENPFVTPVNIETIEVFMNKVGYQGGVDKVSAFYTKNLAQPWQTMFKDFMNNVKQKKEAIHYPRSIKLIIAVLIKKFLEIPKRIEEDYHSIKDDILLICATNDFKEYEMVFMKVDVPMNQPQSVVYTQGMHRSTLRAHRTPTLTAIPQGKKRKQSEGESSSPHKSLKITIRKQKVVEGNKDDDDFENRLETKSHKDNPEHVDDDDDKDDEKVDEDEGGDMGSLETRTEETQTTNPTPSRSLNQVLHLGVSQLVEKATKELIETNLKPCIATTIIEDRDAFCSEVPDLVSQEFNEQAPKIIEDLFKNYVKSNVIQVHPTTTTLTETTSSAGLQQQLYFKMKRSLQDQANDPALWEVMKCIFENSSTSNTFCRDDDIYSHHDDHQKDDAPPEGEKRVKRHKALKSLKSVRGSSSKHSAKDFTTYVSKQQQQQEWDAWVEETVIDEDEVIPEDETSELIINFQDVDKRVPTIFDYERMRATLNDALSNQFKNAEEVYKQNQRKVRENPEDYFSKHKITGVIRITTDQRHGLDFMEQIIVMRDDDKPYSFSKADFKYLNKNDIEDLYYLCRKKKVNYREIKLMNSLITFIRSRMIWERVHDFQFRIESYQIKVNLTAPTIDVSWY
ncbi:hypothetical protein Tco_0721844 [Tanacetum coccineum]